MHDSRLHNWLRTHAQTARVIFSVCTGALLLGAAGLLEGRRATTHLGVARAAGTLRRRRDRRARGHRRKSRDHSWRDRRDRWCPGRSCPTLRRRRGTRNRKPAARRA